ncbi:glycosyltransferase [Legionella maceachernii]|uniref:Glycosyltransferase n=1 Tax=Legionella maceachernii TaxID=466 RepID=A0A0W0VVB2_9GAMM|nr:glycosyltransferase [Legionella maceachernii]KTD24019.1 glycosyltransferase [Legionella maceachernii]SKA24554.1 Glycosyltransferase sugar-binding region containing DXD motif-containing protein [Legionella maceachernii]SUP04322.1 Mannosyltransferase OCH1 and related enzymes [Legionella maceachernii]
MKKEDSSITQVTKAPKIIHYIWVGGPIPVKYLKTIEHVSKVAQRSGFEVNLWVDNDMNYIKTSSKEDILIPNLRLRNISELKQGMRKDPLYQGDKFKKYWEFLDREQVGFKNYASIADMLRFEILRQEGGYYFDTDIEFQLEESSRFIADEIPFGIKAHIDLNYAYVDPIYQLRGFEDVNCDILVAEPQHLVMKEAILKVLEQLESWDREPYEQSQYGPHATTMDVKRLHFKPRKGLYPRRELSIDLGPGSLRAGLIKLLEVRSSGELEELRTLTLGDDYVRSSLPKPILGITVISHCDKTWLTKKRKKDQKSFEAEDILGKTPKQTPSVLQGSYEVKKNNSGPKKRLSMFKSHEPSEEQDIVTSPKKKYDF